MGKVYPSQRKIVGTTHRLYPRFARARTFYAGSVGNRDRAKEHKKRLCNDNRPYRTLLTFCHVPVDRGWSLLPLPHPCMFLHDLSRLFVPEPMQGQLLLAGLDRVLTGGNLLKDLGL